jgi:hypothetical protein
MRCAAPVVALRPKLTRHSTRQAAHDCFAQHWLESAQVIVDTKLQIEKARIDALDFDGQGAAGRFTGDDGIAGHAADSQIESSVGLYKSGISPHNPSNQTAVRRFAGCGFCCGAANTVLGKHGSTKQRTFA